MYALLIAFAAFTTTPALASFEIKGHYDGMTTSPSSFNKQMEDYVTNAPDITGPTGYGADAMYKMPVLPLVFGLRYDTFSFKKTGEGKISGTPVTTTAELNGTRTALLVGYRLISTPVGYAGLLAHVTASQKVKFGLKSKNVVGVTNEDTFTGEASNGYGLGAEGALTFGHLLLGAEVGYTILKINKFNSDGGEALDDNAQSLKMDLSGTYFKVSVGGRF